MKYSPFEEENPPYVDNAPFSRVFVSDNKVEIKPFHDKISNRYITPNLATTHSKMVISRGFLKGFLRDEFVTSLIQNKIASSDFECLIDKLEMDCGKFRMLRMFFAMMLVCFFSGLTFITIFLFNHYRNQTEYQDLLLSVGLGVLLGGGLGFILSMIILLIYYQHIISRNLIPENEKNSRKGLYWNISSFAQYLTLDIKTL